MYKDCVLTPSPTMEAISLHCVVTAATQHAVGPKIESGAVLYKVVTPYDPKAWHIALQEASPIYSFPNIIHDLTHDTPIGNLPLLTYTFLPNNLTSVDIDPDYMDSFLVDLGCMNGLFSIPLAHLIFRTTPLGFLEKPRLSMLCLI